MPEVYRPRHPERTELYKLFERDRVQVRTPPDPSTGRRVMDLDRLELIRRLCTQIPARRQHLVRYYGWYSGCARGAHEVCGFGDGGRAARRRWGCDCRARRPITAEGDDEAAAGRR